MPDTGKCRDSWVQPCVRSKEWQESVFPNPCQGMESGIIGRIDIDRLSSIGILFPERIWFCFWLMVRFYILDIHTATGDTAGYTSVKHDYFLSATLWNIRRYPKTAIIDRTGASSYCPLWFYLLFFLRLM